MTHSPSTASETQPPSGTGLSDTSTSPSMLRIATLSDRALGGNVLSATSIQTVEEFRERFPLTRYEDYEATLGERREDAKARINAALKRLEPEWADLETMAGLRPLVVTYPPTGAFDRYAESRRRAGADLGHVKPLHMNATDAAIGELTALAGEPIGSTR